MFKTILAAEAAGPDACVHDAPPPVTLAPKRRRKPPPEPPASETERCCGTCHEPKSAELFVKRKGNPTTTCKECHAKSQRERRARDPEAARARARARNAANPEPARAYAKSERGRERRQAYLRSDRGRESQRHSTAKFKARRPEVAAAHRAVRKALRAGEIQKAPVCHFPVHLMRECAPARGGVLRAARHFCKALAFRRARPRRGPLERARRFF
jgi:hypothetical protein